MKIRKMTLKKLQKTYTISKKNQNHDENDRVLDFYMPRSSLKLFMQGNKVPQGL